MSISVCVPVHDPEGAYSRYLLELVISLSQQDLPPDELVLASNHEIINLSALKSIVADRFNLVLVRTKAKNAPANLNEAVRNCSSDYVKILFQDDILTYCGSLASSLETLKREKAVWCAVGFDHLDDERQQKVRPMVPKFSEKLVRGKNQIGAPSVIMFRRRNWIEFDERMVFTFDCDWYLGMAHRWGNPAIDTNFGVTVRLHAGQATHWARKKLMVEISMMRKKHIRSHSFRWGRRESTCSCLTSAL